MVIRYNHEGWPKHVPYQLKGYSAARAALSAEDGLLLYGDRIAIPASLREEVLEQINRGHQWLTKSHRRADITGDVRKGQRETAESMKMNLTEVNVSAARSRSTLPNSTLEMLGSPVLTLALPTIYLLVFVLSTPCNLVSLWLLCRRTERKTPTVVFAINLSLTDLLYSASLPLQIAYHLRGNDWPFGVAMCSVATGAFYGNMHCSVLTTCAISLERYRGVVHPLRARRRRPGRKAALICLLIWACVLAVHTRFLLNDLTFHVERLGVTTCFDVIPRAVFPDRSLGYVYFGASLLLFFAAPLVVLTGCYAAIVCALCRSRRLDATTAPRQPKRQTQLLVAAVVLCFLCCYLPNTALQLLHMVYTSWGESLYVYYKLSLGVNSLNCCFDPFVYYFASREFRQKLRLEFEAVSRYGVEVSGLNTHKKTNKVTLFL
ncbi:hypothetical protein AAFF_G00219810 [Aldrovandia affinis]|uniref:G-protein coupled receptors family 1 profile domain-containing protein n=1 Tax=Aldrovandia affinis TaxID=143900 RepID=A0AAD7W444_9TELE|nr:hypothetical protein AAFF_G00219810 [Aldrovandia affinis]